MKGLLTKPRIATGEPVSLVGMSLIIKRRHFIFHPTCLSLVLLIAVALAGSVSLAQRRTGAHSTRPSEGFTAADRSLVERAVGVTCAERLHDPLASVPIDVMQSRPSLSVNNPDAVSGAKRADRLLPVAKELVARVLYQLAEDYQVSDTAAGKNRIAVSIARIQSVRRIKPDVDARDNASVLLREPHSIEFGTIFLASLRSDEGMISVLSHELTHIADGQPDSLRPLFHAVAVRASTRSGLRVTGQRAEELTCDLVGLMAAREFIKENVSWEPLTRRLARAVEHNCVDDDASDDEHLSPRNTIRAVFTLNLSFANEVVNGERSGALSKPANRLARPATLKSRNH